MKPSDIMLDLGRPVAYYSGFAKLWGPAAGVFFSQLFYWHGKAKDKDQWIYKTQEEIEDETGLSSDSQQTARNRLKAAGVLEEKYNRLEHRLYYRVVIDKLNDIFEGLSENPRLGKRTSSDSLIGTAQITTENTRTPETENAPVPASKSVVRKYDPDIPEQIAKPKKQDKRKKYYQPYNLTMAPMIAQLCGLSLANVSKSICFDAAEALRTGINPPKSPNELIPLFGKNGKIYAEWPSRTLHPMDIPKYWPRLSGAVKPPEAAPDHATNADLLAQGYKL